MMDWYFISFQGAVRRVRLYIASHFVGDVGSLSSSPQQVDASSSTSGLHTTSHERKHIDDLSLSLST